MVAKGLAYQFLRARAEARRALLSAAGAFSRKRAGAERPKKPRLVEPGFLDRTISLEGSLVTPVRVNAVR
jgi:hypothetical protein